MNNVSIRRMTAEDVDRVHQIDAACFSIPWSKKSLEDEMTSNKVARYLVAERGGEIVAFAGMHVILDEGHITNIAVSEECRRQGVGEKLMRALLQYAANLGVGYMTLEVRVSNESAIGLYRKIGFFKVHVRKKYYEDNGEDGYLMVIDRMPPADENFTEPETVTEQ